jgi:hypothetical protein
MINKNKNINLKFGVFVYSGSIEHLDKPIGEYAAKKIGEK